MDLVTQLALRRECSMCYWWPLVRNVDVPKPETVIVTLSEQTVKGVLSHTSVDGLHRAIMQEAIHAVCPAPYFLRTDQMACKHSWGETCFVPDSSQETFEQHACALIEETVNRDVVFDYEVRALVFRQFMSLLHTFTAFNGLPISREFRVFARGGTVESVHFYWPEEAVLEGRPSKRTWRADLRTMAVLLDHERDAICEMAEKVSAALGPEQWSIDFAYTEPGAWLFIDAARGELSWNPEREGE